MMQAVRPGMKEFQLEALFKVRTSRRFFFSLSLCICLCLCLCLAPMRRSRTAPSLYDESLTRAS